MAKDSGKIYVMYNPKNHVIVECTKKYVLEWISRGFEILEIKEGDILD